MERLLKKLQFLFTPNVAFLSHKTLVTLPLFSFYVLTTCGLGFINSKLVQILLMYTASS